ncbi:MAG: hypothetical protein IPL96_02125 [Holophagaceae bacterium]|nr:hypothetical protein [Holophagaceae bacterium]
MNRRLCPSCQARLSPYAAECPECGLGFERKQLPRPLLFQVSAAEREPGRPSPQALRAPALGRVAPVALDPATATPEAAEALPLPTPTPEAEEADAGSSFWPLVRLESLEAVLLVALNGLFAVLAARQLGLGLAAAYENLWPFLAPLHLGLSWCLMLVPLVLSGQSPLMARFGFQLGSEQAERRLAFSLFHLLSVGLFPLSFLCMVLTPNHRTLAELMTGQEIIFRPWSRMR